MGKFAKVFLPLLASVSLFASVNINTASKEELMSIKGIGEGKALAIISYRKHTPFKTKEDIKNIKGIGDKLYNSLKDEISVSGQTKIEKTEVKKDSTKNQKNHKKDKKTKDSKDQKTTKELKTSKTDSKK